jgi:pSer/pThr/pTyr-binding forkhead associated (FHA) protein
VKCRRCGHENEVGANFCSSCGTPLTGDEESTLTLAAIEDRQALEEELGAALTDLPAGVGLLVVRRGPNAGSTYVLDRDSTTLGRHPESDIFLDDVTVSRRHAVVKRIEDRYEVDDADSLNGTYVDHRRIDTATLHDLAELQVGRYVLTFVLGGGGAGAQ